MTIGFDEKEIVKEIKCHKIELNAKPGLTAGTVNSSSTLVLVVDMVNGFCRSGALGSERCDQIVAPISRFLETITKAKRVFIRDCHSESSVEFKWFPKHCHNKEECSLVSDLLAFDGIDVPKNSTNGFFSLIKKIPDLDFYKNIVIVGVCTDICILQLALSCRAYLNEINSSCNVVVFTDLVETYDSNLHSADLMNMYALKFMEQAGVQLFKNII